MLGNKNRGWVGVDLGQHAIKIAQLHRAGNRLSLRAAAVYPRGSRGLNEDLIAATMLAEQTVGSRAAATLSMSQSLVEPDRTGETPELGRCSDTWSAGPNHHYQLSVESQLVDATLDGLSTAGLACEAIDGAPLAIARAVQLTPDWRPDELLGVVDWGESTVSFVASEGGVAKYVRRLRCDGFSMLRREVAESLGVSEHDAERTMQQTDASRPQGRRVVEALRSAVHAVSQEVGRTLEHLGSKLKTPGPQRLVVLGVGGTIPCLPGLLGEGVALPTEAWRASGLASSDEPRPPDCLMAQAIALSALVWEAEA